MDAQQVLESQILRNRQTRNNWERSREHREIIFKHLTHHGNASLLRCYGAGNCNDLDLIRLVRSFTAIELVDISRKSASVIAKGFNYHKAKRKYYLLFKKMNPNFSSVFMESVKDSDKHGIGAAT